MSIFACKQTLRDESKQVYQSLQFNTMHLWIHFIIRQASCFLLRQHDTKLVN